MRRPSREVHKPAMPGPVPPSDARVQRGARGAGGGAASQEAPAQVIAAFAPARFPLLLRLLTSLVLLA